MFRGNRITHSSGPTVKGSPVPVCFVEVVSDSDTLNLLNPLSSSVLQKSSPRWPDLAAAFQKSVVSTQTEQEAGVTEGAPPQSLVFSLRARPFSPNKVVVVETPGERATARGARGTDRSCHSV